MWPSGWSCIKLSGALSFSVSCEERHTIPAVFLLFLHHLRVLLIVLPCVHGECGGRHVCSSDEQQSYRELQQRSAATSASTCTAAASKPTSTAAAAATVISDQTLCPVKQHPEPAQQPSSTSLNCPVSANAQHTNFISSQLSASVHIRAYPGIQFGTGTGPGIKQSWHDRDQQCQPNGRFRLGGTPHSSKHNGGAHFGLHTCSLCSGCSIGRLIPEQHHPVQHFSGEQHFHPHLWLQWSHYQRGRDGAGVTGLQPCP